MFFLSLPVEIRVIIYQIFLAELQHVVGNSQPLNEHIAILQTCRQMTWEAEHLANFRSYVSLSDEAQISAFNSNISIEAASKITTIDVANDSRLVRAPDLQLAVPTSGLHLVLSKLVSLRRLRVFESYRSRPMKDFVLGAKFALQFEKALFPSGVAPHLDSYEIYLSPFKSSNGLFQVVSSESIQTLRLSGDCGLVRGATFPRLTNFAINGVTGHHLETHLVAHFAQSPLRTLCYKQGDKAQFELRNHHLEALIFGSASGLHKLVLLGCSHLSSSTLTSCLWNLEQLQYFALSFVSVNELDSDFVVALSPSLVVLKLGVTNARYTIPRLQEEHGLCDSIEELVIKREPLRVVHIHFRAEIMTAMERNHRWTRIALERRLILHLGPWDVDEIF